MRRLCHVSKAMEKIRARNWCLVLYPEDESHYECILRLSKSAYKFAAVLHDRDTWSAGESENHEPGEHKKDHWHVVLKFAQARWNTAVAEELGIKPNYLEPCRNMDGALLYLVHDGFPDKYQYDSEEVFGSLKPALAKLLVADDEGSRVLEIINMIDNTSGRVSFREILVKACNNGLYGEFRRMGSGVKWLIDEHNAEYESELYGYLKNYDIKQRIDGMSWDERCERLDRQRIVPPGIE